MCGIAGILSINSDVDPVVILNMTNRIKHRGPDDEGFIHVSDSGCITELRGDDSKINKPAHIKDFNRPARLLLGHRRLSIIDTSSAGHQPMPYKNRRYWIAFNGEIYNYLELKEYLRSRGRFFYSNTDTEVILAAYDVWGENCVKHFNGDWAFALYDSVKNALFLSVDRVSVKSLYYRATENYFIFGSEIKALFASGLVERKPDLNQLMIYVFSWLHDFSEKTMYEGVYRLKPSTNLVIDTKNLSAQEKKYWNCPFELRREIFDGKKAKTYSSEVRDILIDSVKLRLRADVPVGSCLSGGVDSSSIVMIINNLLKEEGIESVGERQKTFTSAYKNEKYVDESFWANKIIKESGAEGFFIYPQAKEFESDMADLIDCQDEPFSSTSIYAQYRVMKEASNHVKVVLDGQGADELFGGYFFYYPYFLAEGNLRDLLFRKRLYGIKQTLNELKLSSIYKILNSEFAKNLREVLSQFYITNIKKRSFKTAENNKIPWSEISSIQRERLNLPFNKILHNDELGFNLQGLLRYEDRNSMRWSVESRVPFTDYRLIEYVMKIPSCYKIHLGWQKWILRESVAGIVSPSTVWRKSKLGFPTPEKEWMSYIYPDKITKTQKYDSVFWRIINSELFLSGIPKVS
ncbi:asparagine synthase (glutamine-hydrolyzing) [candidate division WOR-3 bacterium]|nr:asparagine synthase (glutamine-hydrolyzing) [candidate division WOR-3 bacterium]